MSQQAPLTPADVPAPAEKQRDSGVRTLLTIVVIGLALSAVVCAGFVLFGDQGDLVARTLWTVLISTAFALIVAAEARIDFSRPWILPVHVVGWAVCGFVALFNTWDLRTSLIDTIYLVPSTILCIVIVELAVIHITLVGRAYWASENAMVQVSSMIAAATVGALALLLVVPMTLRPSPDFPDIYWRATAAVAIIAAAATVIAPLVDTIFRPRPAARPVAEPVAQTPVGYGQPQTQQPLQVQQPSYAQQPPHAQQHQQPQQAWPTYYSTTVPLPVMPDGQPDWQAYQTGQPSPGSRPYPGYSR